MMEFNGIQPNPESMLKSRPKLCCIRPLLSKGLPRQLSGTPAVAYSAG